MRTRFKLVSIAVLLPITLVATGCDKTLDSGDLQSKIKQSIESTSSGLKVTKVACPSDITAKKGKTFQCTVTSSTGTTVAVTVTLLDDNGKFTYAPASSAGTTTAPATTTTTPAATTPAAPTTTP